MWPPNIIILQRVVDWSPFGPAYYRWLPEEIPLCPVHLIEGSHAQLSLYSYRDQSSHVREELTSREAALDK